VRYAAMWLMAKMLSDSTVIRPAAPSFHSADERKACDKNSKAREQYSVQQINAALRHDLPTGSVENAAIIPAEKLLSQQFITLPRVGPRRRRGRRWSCYGRNRSSAPAARRTGGKSRPRRGSGGSGRPPVTLRAGLAQLWMSPRIDWRRRAARAAALHLILSSLPRKPEMKRCNTNSEIEARLSTERYRLQYNSPV
jgi:hypothetical protein